MRDRVNVEHPPATPALFMVILGASEKKTQFNDSDFKAMAGRSNIEFRMRTEKMNFEHRTSNFQC